MFLDDIVSPDTAVLIVLIILIVAAFLFTTVNYDENFSGSDIFTEILIIENISTNWWLLQRFCKFNK